MMMTELGGIERAYNNRISAEDAFGITEADIIAMLEQRDGCNMTNTECAEALFEGYREEDENSLYYTALHEKRVMVFADAYRVSKGVPDIKAEECCNLICYVLTGYDSGTTSQYRENDRQRLCMQIADYIGPSLISDYLQHAQQAQVAHAMINFCVSLYTEQQRGIEVPLDKGGEEQQKEAYTTRRHKDEADTAQWKQEQVDEVERLKKTIKDDITLVHIRLVQRNMSAIVLNEWIATAEEAIKSSNVERMQKAGRPLHHFLYIQTEHL